MTKWTLKAGLAAAILGLAIGASTAKAGILPTGYSVSPIEGTDHWLWTYNVVLATDSTLLPGDFFTIYDFAGFIEGSVTTPLNFDVTVNNPNRTPPGTLPVDDPNVPDFTFTYTGEPLENPTTGRSLPLGAITMESLYGDSKSSSFTSRTHRTSDGVVESTITLTQVPIAGNGSGGGMQTPEPATLTLVALGLPVLGAARLVRKRRQK